MNEPETSTDLLISRHYDEPLTPQENQALSELLRNDPPALQRFAATARVHAALEAHAPDIPKASKIRWARWIAAGAAAAAVLIWAGLALPPGRTGWKTTIMREKLDALPDGKSENPKPPGLTKRIVKSPVSAAGQGTADVQELLSRYYVNTGPHGRTVPQALDDLMAAIKSSNYFQRAELDQLIFHALGSHNGADTDPVIATPLGSPMTVSDFLGICRLYGEVADNTGGKFPFTIPPGVSRIPSPRSAQVGGIPEVAEIKVRPDFLSQGGVGPPYPEGNLTAAVLARSYGIQLAEDESATFSSNPSTITVLARPWKLEALQSRTAMTASVAPKQVFLTGKYIRIPVGLLPEGFNEETGAVMNDYEFQTFMRLIAGAAGVNLVSAPSIILRLGQAGRISLTREIGSVVPALAEVGLSQDSTATPSGELTKVEGLVDLGFLSGVVLPHGLDKLGIAPALGQSGDGRVQHFRTEYELWLPDRSTGLFVADLPLKKDYRLLVCVTATWIDPAGQPIRENANELEVRLRNLQNAKEKVLKAAANGARASGKAIAEVSAQESADEVYLVAIPVKGNPGFVLNPNALDKGIIDVTGLSKGSKIKCPFTGETLILP